MSEEYLELDSAPFGKSSMQVFKKPQAMSGLGAALGKLIDFEIIAGLESVFDVIPRIEPGGDTYLEEINRSLSWLKSNAKKIGNAQRTFFSFYFRDLFNPDSESYLNLQLAAKTALRKYQAQNF
ncbi:hypothetical protein [Arthrobacter sp. YC-RL1]|uniref:hypothetical protein n=1 Tax=Arthrobacter sp. YC-RL1 TaxID=1652545 RepID=UPI00128E1973|nr:hypothetical protein [Arthrobacter sp. YC-RL1]